MATVNARTSPLWIKFQALRYDNDILFKNRFHLWRTQGKGGDREKRKKKKQDERQFAKGYEKCAL